MPAEYGPFCVCMVPPPQVQSQRRPQTRPNMFRAYVQTLPNWEQVLLGKLYCTGLGQMPLHQLLQTTEEIWVVTNGGVNKSYGYFRFVIATGSQILCKGNGQAQGNAMQIESLRAESGGRLAALRFSVRYIKFHNITPRTEM
eukprot:14026876-Ditylum_brightwellii.AAC.1